MLLQYIQTQTSKATLRLMGLVQYTLGIDKVLLHHGFLPNSTIAILYFRRANAYVARQQHTDALADFRKGMYNDEDGAARRVFGSGVGEIVNHQ